jgi:hypothetical protein
MLDNPLPTKNSQQQNMARLFLITNGTYQIYFPAVRAALHKTIFKNRIPTKLLRLELKIKEQQVCIPANAKLEGTTLRFYLNKYLTKLRFIF